MCGSSWDKELCFDAINRAKIKRFHNFHGQNIEAWILQIQNNLIFATKILIRRALVEMQEWKHDVTGKNALKIKYG